ncbi:MAG: hypothetical protein GX339_03575 [Tissierellia bacterium]|nr:hypothetical protein [Tissierellia bacterium]
MKNLNDREILNHIKNSVDQAPIDILDNIKNQTVVKMIKHDDITRQESKSSKTTLKSIMSFAAAAAVFLFMFNIFQFRLPDSEIYIDVNPGVQITTNRRDDVIKLLPINDEAAEIVKDIEFKGKEIEIVTGEIVDSLIDNNYISEDDDVMLLSVYNKDLEKSKRQVREINDTIHKKLDDNHKNPILLSQSIDKSNTVDEFAKKYGVSVGKMTFIRNMIILNPELKTEELVDLSLSRLIEISNDIGIDIEKIIDSGNDERITNPIVEPLPVDDDYDDDNDDDNESRHLIGNIKAMEIALGLANGKIVDFELDEDDGYYKYEIEIVADGYEYEIELDAYTGEVLEFEKDD